MRHRVDSNQDEIVKALRKKGCSVEVIGRPVDLLIGYKSKNYLVECKNRDGLNKLTPFQERWIPQWRGQVRIVHSVDEAIELVTKAYSTN